MTGHLKTGRAVRTWQVVSEPGLGGLLHCQEGLFFRTRQFALGPGRLVQDQGGCFWTGQIVR
jgi:hypothetical protein